MIGCLLSSNNNFQKVIGMQLNLTAVSCLVVKKAPAWCPIKTKLIIRRCARRDSGRGIFAFQVFCD